MTCHNCRVDAAKAGKRPDGFQRYRCGQCGKTFSAQKEQDNLFGTKQAVPDDKALLALTLLVEGGSIRSIERITGLHRDTIMKLLVAAGERCERIVAERIKGVIATDVQCDEIWTFVGKKHSNRREGDSDKVGDAWTFIAVERGTKLVLAFELGSRDMAVTERFMGKLAQAAGTSRFQLSTDGMVSYPLAVGRVMGIDDRCDYGQVIKTYRAAPVEEQRRYSPPTIASIEYKAIYGDPDQGRICTSHIERVNGSLRQWCKRLTRLTYAFSKKWENLKSALALHFAYYNFCRIHRTIKKTPAMASGLADHCWTMAELMAV